MSTANIDNTLSSPSDEDLFNEPPQKEDCQICFLRLPTLGTGSKYSNVVGKLYAVGAFMHPFMIIMVTRSKRNAPFAELLRLLQTRR